MMKGKGCYIFLLLGALMVSEVHSDPTISVPGLNPVAFRNVTNLLAGGVAQVGAPPLAECSPSGTPIRMRNRRCRQNFERMIADGEFSFGIGIGYLDPAVDGVSPALRYSTIINNLTCPCVNDESENPDCPHRPPPGVGMACGFSVRELNLTAADGSAVPGTNFSVLTKTFEYRDARGRVREVTARVNVCNPHTPAQDPVLRTRQSATCAAVFAQSVKHDDVTSYVGHSRYGYGPDFSPPRTRGNPPHIDSGYYRRRSGGVERFFSPEALAPNPQAPRSTPERKEVYMLSCSSDGHFSDTLMRNLRSMNRPRGSFSYGGTTRAIDADGTEAVRLLEGLGTGRCGRGLNRALANTSDGRFFPADYDSGTGESAFQMVLRTPQLEFSNY